MKIIFLSYLFICHGYHFLFKDFWPVCIALYHDKKKIFRHVFTICNVHIINKRTIEMIGNLITVFRLPSASFSNIVAVLM